MKLTPLDIHHKEFRNALRGYSPEEVDDFLDEVADDFERLFKENIDLSERLKAADVRLKEYATLEHTLQNTLVSAQTSAEDIKSRAAADSDRLLREAEAKAAEIVSSALEQKQHSQAEYARLQKAEQEFRASFRRMLERYLKDVADAVETPAPAPAPAATLELEPTPVAAPVPDSEPEPEPEPAPVERVESGAVTSLTLGEVGEPEQPVEDEMPTLEIPEEFVFPPRAAVGELDDLDIEEID